MLAGIVMMGCGVLLLILPPIGIGVILFGIVSFFGGIFAGGRICTACKFKTA